MKRAPVGDLKALLFESSGATPQPQTSPTADVQLRSSAEGPSGAAAAEPIAPAAQLPSVRTAEPPNDLPPHRRNRPTAAKPSAAAPQEPKGATADVRPGRARSGSLVNPYERADGQKTVHVTFSFPVELAQQLRVFCASLPPGQRNEWAAEWLRRGMGE